MKEQTHSLILYIILFIFIGFIWGIVSYILFPFILLIGLFLPPLYYFLALPAFSAGFLTSFFALVPPLSDYLPLVISIFCAFILTIISYLLWIKLKLIWRALKK